MADVSEAREPRWTALYEDTALAMDAMVAVQRGRHDLLMVRTAAGVQAFGNLCPHKMCPLVEGQLVDGIITCKAHRWSFSAVDGRGINPRGPTLRVYATRIRDGQIQVDLG